MFLQGVFAGLMFSILAITSMILVGRSILLRGLGHGVAACFGAFLPQVIFVTIAIACLTVLHLNASTFHSFTMSNHIVAILSFLLLVYVAYKIYNDPMPELNKLEVKTKCSSFAKVFAISIGRPMRIVGYMALLAIFTVPLGSITMLQTLPLLVGIMLSLLVWWMLFIAAVYGFRKRATPESIYKFSKIGALIIFVIAFLALLTM